MQISSNIAAVISKLEQLRAKVPMAASAALAQPDWEAQAVDTARRTLQAIAQPKEARYVEDFVKAVKVVGTAPALLMTMGNPQFEQLAQEAEEARQRVAAVLAAGGAPDPGDLLKVVTVWVETPVADGGKRHDHRDARKTDDEIAEFITYLLTADPAQLRGDRLAARNALQPHVHDWIRGGNITMARETVDAWMRAVRAAWRVMVTAQFPAKMRSQLRTT